MEGGTKFGSVINSTTQERSLWGGGGGRFLINSLSASIVSRRDETNKVESR